MKGEIMKGKRQKQAWMGICLALSTLSLNILPSYAADAAEQAEQPEQVTRNHIIYELRPGEAAVIGLEETSAHKLEIPESIYMNGTVYTVSTISSGAIVQTDLQTICIPPKVDVIEKDAFQNNPQLETITLENSKTRWSKDCFEDCPKAKLYSGSKLLWQAASSSQPNSSSHPLQVQGKWIQDGDGWSFELDDGSAPVGTWIEVHDCIYYLDDNGHIVIGWQYLNGDDYFFNQEGMLAKNRWIGSYYVNQEGKWVLGSWKVKDGKDYFVEPDGTIKKNAWKKDGSSWYYLGPDGFTIRGRWMNINGADYYFEANGVMAADKWVDGWYLKADGAAIQPGWKKKNGRYYYVNKDGSIPKNIWQEIDGKRYFFDQDGLLCTGLCRNGGITYFTNSEGEMLTNVFVNVSGTGHYFDQTGAMVTSPFRISGVRFLPDGGGAISRVSINGKVYSSLNWSKVFGSRSYVSKEAASSGIIAQTKTPNLSGEPLRKTIDGVSYQMLRFPMKTMKISQGAGGSYSHQGNDALDICGVDSGVDEVYAPCDMHYIGKDSYAHGNAVFFESDEPVLFADGTIDYATFMFIHDTYINDLKSSYKQGEAFGDEGVAGYATGNHCHFEVAKGKFSRMYFKNVYGVYVLPQTVSPDAACVIDGVELYNGGQSMSDGRTMHWKKSSEVSKSAGISSKPAGAVDEQGKFWITASAIKVRKRPSTSGEEAGFSYSYGTSVVYDCYIRKDGHTWLGFVDRNGNRLWMASGQHNGKEYTERFGVFE